MSDQYGSPWSNPTGGNPGSDPPSPQQQPVYPPSYGAPPTYETPTYETPPTSGAPVYGPRTQQPYPTPPPPAHSAPQPYGNQQQYGGPPQQPYATFPAPPLRNDYASWGKRVGANLIDSIPSLVGLLVFYVGYFVWIFEMASSGSGAPELGPGLIPMIIGGVLVIAGLGWTVYNRWITAGRTGQSLGKRVTKIVLISDELNAPIGPLNAFLRDLVHTLDGFAYVGYLWPLWDEKKQTFSDKLMKTIVIDAPRPTP